MSEIAVCENARDETRTATAGDEAQARQGATRRKCKDNGVKEVGEDQWRAKLKTVTHEDWREVRREARAERTAEKVCAESGVNRVHSDSTGWPTHPP